MLFNNKITNIGSSNGIIIPKVLEEYGFTKGSKINLVYEQEDNQIIVKLSEPVIFYSSSIKSFYWDEYCFRPRFFEDGETKSTVIEELGHRFKTGLTGFDLIIVKTHNNSKYMCFTIGIKNNFWHGYIISEEIADMFMYDDIERVSTKLHEITSH